MSKRELYYELRRGGMGRETARACVVETSLMAAAPSMHDALWAIANMQVQEETDKGEVLALCISIARLELEKCSTVGK